jgi:hypothetical protein
MMSPVVALTFCAFAQVASPKTAALDVRDLEFFEKKVRPLLVEECYGCHSSDAKKLGGELYLDRRSGWQAGGSLGPAVVAGKPADSLLIRAVKYVDPDLQMPPNKRLSKSQVGVLEEWVRRGAPDPRDGEAPLRVVSEIDFDAGRRYWAFQTLQDSPVPSVKQRSWLRDPLDAFVLARLEAAGLTPSPEADRAVLARRLYNDVTGLPPTPSRLRSFVTDRSPDAYTKLVDELLESPHFGEKWARHWLDIVRYGSDLSGAAASYPQAWRYRDWVTRAWNHDMPYDRFIALQLAADHVEPDDLEERVALGLLGLGRQYMGSELPDDKERADEWDDSIDVISQAFLGLTVACARCHDHKFDPVSTADYYALAGVFASTRFADIIEGGVVRSKPFELSKEEQKSPPKLLAHVVADGEAQDVPVFLRGNTDTKGAIVPRRFLTVFADGAAQLFVRGSGRLELARALAIQVNPLTARVFVNRVWGYCFGEPLVRTANNFGRLGTEPTHPFLLDHLAGRFVESDGSLKRLLRSLLLSATYRQASGTNPEQLAADPDNRLLGRMPRRRLSVEAWRDAVLSATGGLDRRVGGVSVSAAASAENQRRTLYTRISRVARDPMLVLFDFPNPSISIGRRAETTTPLQHLFLLNSDFMMRSATRLGKRLLALPLKDRAARVRATYDVLFFRAPTAAEELAVLEFLDDRKRKEEATAADEDARWILLAQTLLMSNDFRYLK